MGSDERTNQERRALARELAKSARLVDRFGRPLIEGCGYTVNMLQPPVYTVNEIVPVLDRADLPPGSFRVRMSAHMTLICSNGIPVDELALCAMSNEMMNKLSGAPDAPPDAPTAPPEASPPAGIHLVSPSSEESPTSVPPAAPEDH